MSNDLASWKRAVQALIREGMEAGPLSGETITGVPAPGGFVTETQVGVVAEPRPLTPVARTQARDTQAYECLLTRVPTVLNTRSHARRCSRCSSRSKTTSGGRAGRTTGQC